MRFSLIVCTLGRRVELVELFDSLLRQKRNDFEMILIDQNTDDRLVNIVARFAERFPLQHIRMTGTGVSRARNLGIYHSRGELIGLPDDDCQYLDDYLDVVDQVFREDPSIGCIAGCPTADVGTELGTEWQTGRMDLDAVTVLDRCQEFTCFVRKDRLGEVRFNERLGLGAQTPWGADEGPDFLIRLIHTSCRLVFFPRLFVYHPDKIATVTPSTLLRAASYSRGRGCLFRLHPFPLRTVLRCLFRVAAGCLVYLVKCQPMRSAYYLAILRGMLRGLCMSKLELADVRIGQSGTPQIQPTTLSLLPSQPLVSVLVCNYNYGRFLPAALDSLLAQTYSNWHTIVCDDGSTDDSVTVIERYCLRDPRIQLLQKDNGGQISTINACYLQARGEIVCFLDADDTFDSRKIERTVEAFRANPKAGACNHFSWVIDAEGHRQPISMNHHLDSGWLANEATSRGACVYVPTTSCMSLRRNLADILFPIPPHQIRDADGYLGMAAQFLAPICVIDEALSGYRIHSHNMGGLTEPTSRRLRYELQLIERRTANVKEFVSNHLGGKIAEQIALEDNPQYIQAALKLLAIERADHRGRRALALIRRHPNLKWRAFWRAIFAAPAPLSRLAVPLMHRSYRLKALCHRLIGRGKPVAA